MRKLRRRIGNEITQCQLKSSKADVKHFGSDRPESGLWALFLAMGPQARRSPNFSLGNKSPSHVGVVGSVYKQIWAWGPIGT